jgi:hypothetical protein
VNRLCEHGPVGAYLALGRGEPDSDDAALMRAALAKAQQNALRLDVPPGAPFPQARQLAVSISHPEFPQARYVDAYEHLISGRLEQGVARLREASLADRRRRTTHWRGHSFTSGSLPTRGRI